MSKYLFTHVHTYTKYNATKNKYVCICKFCTIEYNGITSYELFLARRNLLNNWYFSEGSDDITYMYMYIKPNSDQITYIIYSPK